MAWAPAGAKATNEHIRTGNTNKQQTTRAEEEEKEKVKSIEERKKRRRRGRRRRRRRKGKRRRKRPRARHHPASFPQSNCFSRAGGWEKQTRITVLSRFPSCVFSWN